jgi:heme-degrading monooxygenase HmoA
MYATITHYRLNPIFEQDFLSQWHKQVQYLKKNKFLFSSVLHRETKISYVTYTRWRSKELFEQNYNSPEEMVRQSQIRIESCCNSISIPFRLHTLTEIKLDD